MSAPALFRAAVDVIFRSPMATPARYVPARGPALTIRIIRAAASDDEAGFGRIGALVTTTRFDVPAAAFTGCPHDPAEGDVIEVDHARYTVKSAARDAERLVWSLAVDEVRRP